MTNLDYFIN